MEESGRARVVPLRRAGALVVVEGVALAVLGVAYAVSGLLGHPEDRIATVLAGLFAVLVGAALVPVGRGLATGRGWALSPTVVVQLFLVVVGVGLVQGRVWAAAVPVLVLAAAVSYLLATPDARATYRDRA